MAKTRIKTSMNDNLSLQTTIHNPPKFCMRGVERYTKYIDLLHISRAHTTYNQNYWNPRVRCAL